MRIWTIQTMNGNYYKIDGRGSILFYSKHRLASSDQWKITGCAERKAFNHLEFQSLQALLNLASWNTDCTFKNGKARFYLCDLDHGTKRVQMEGIRRVFATDEMEQLSK